MSGVANSDLLDLTKTTLNNLPSNEFEVALEYQEYQALNFWFKDHKKIIESGTSIKRNVVLETSGNARHVRLYQKTPINVADVQKQIEVPWVQAQTHWSIERREALRNRAPARFIELIKSRRIDGSLDLADLLEQRAWLAPNSSTDDLNPYGVPYWITMGDNNDSALTYVAAGGFQGHKIAYNVSGTTSSKGGIDGSTSANAKWRNWAAEYESINSEFVKRLRKAFHATKFTSPVTVADLKSGPASNYRIYMGLEELTEYEDLVTKQNDNLGADADKFHGATSFKRVPVLYTPPLDSDTYDPVYGINHSKFYPVVQSGDWMRENEPMFDVEQHNVMTVFVDCSYNFICTNPRTGGFVLHKTKNF